MLTLSVQRLCALAVVCAATSPVAAQTTYYVDGTCGEDSWTGLQSQCEPPNGPKKTIQAALNLAGHGDTVILADGSYAWEGNTNLEFEGNSITLRSAGGREVCEIVGFGGDRGGINFDSGEGPDAIVEGITFRDCWRRTGGAIRVSSMSTPTIRDCAFIECFSISGLGAGISLEGQSGATIQNCYFFNNFVNGHGGGGIAARDAWLVIDDCEFIGNSVVAGASGAAIYLTNGAELTANRCSFIRNRAYEEIIGSAPDNGLRGGAVYLGENCTGIFADCNFARNEIVAYQVGTGAFGGGAYLASGSTGSFLRCVFEGNRAEGGGGGKGWESRGSAIRNFGASLDVVDCLIINNVTGSGAIASVDGHVRIVNSTIAGNRGHKGVGALESLDADDMVAVNTIIWDNSLPQIGGDPSIEFSCVQHGWPGQGNIASDPMFTDPALGDYRLSAGSPCIDAGDSQLMVCGRDSSIDLNGEDRFRDDKRVTDTGRGAGAIVDMGSHESPGVSGIRLVCAAPLTAGETSKISVAQARAGWDVHFAYGLGDGATPVPGCRPQRVLIDQARLLGRAIADESGRAVLQVQIPRGAAGRTIWIQAIERDTCRISNLAVVTIPN